MLFNKYSTLECMKPSDIDAIFTDNYKPPWLVLKEQLIEKSFTNALQAKVNLEYRLNAYDTLRRIAKKHTKVSD